jgi:hypothetical protein
MPSSGMLHRVVLSETDVSEERTISSQCASVASYCWCCSYAPTLVTLMEAICSSETSVLKEARWRNIAEDSILHSHRRENLKFYNIGHFKLSCLLEEK